MASLRPVFTDVPSDAVDLRPLIRSWLRALRSRNRSAATIKVYERAALGLAAYLLAYEPPDDEAQPIPEEVEDIHREHVEGYITSLLESGLSTSSVHQVFRSLKTFCNWCVDEEEMTRSPMRTMQAPTVGEVEVPVIDDQALERLFKTVSGRDFESRRDRAILMVFLDTGGRLSEVTKRQVQHMDLDLQVLLVLGKGDRERSAPFGKATAQAVDRYFRAYAKYIGRPLEATDPLWINVLTKQALTISGVAKMLERRCAQAGLPRLHPHQFRHTLAHLWKLNGGNEDALMRIMGWRSREMLSRYGSSAGAARARQEHKALSPGDRLGR